MLGIWDVVRNISTPLLLSGLVVAIMYLLFRTILKMDIFKPLTRQMGGKLIFRIVNIIFIIALITIVFGFIGYLMDKTYPPIQPKYVSMETDKDLPLETLVQAFAKGRNITVFFQDNCDEPLRKSLIEKGLHEGDDARGFLQSLAERKKGTSINYLVKQEGERRYEIVCS